MGGLVNVFKDSREMSRTFVTNQISGLRYVTPCRQKLRSPSESILSHKIMDGQVGDRGEFPVECPATHTNLMGQFFNAKLAIVQVCFEASL